MFRTTTALPQTAHPGLMARLRAHLARINSAHARQARFTPQALEISRDIGLPVELLLGHSAYDPALPFFLQRGFDRAD